MMNQKINKNDNVIGRRVIVHPFLTTDPIQRPGETGKVIEVSSENPDVLTVEFNDGNVGAYFASGLLTMQTKKEILIHLLANNLVIGERACKNMIRICRLLSEKRQGDALELTISDETTQALCTINCETWMELKANQRKSSTKRKGLK